MPTLDSKFWAGTEQSLEKFLASEKLDISAMQPQDSEDGPPRLFAQSGNVGIITIAGSLVNNDSWMNAYMGRTSYGEIRDALVHAASDPNIGAIVLDVNSGGGAASGVSDIADLIKKIDKEVKPIHTFSDGMIASAAYWLGSSARSVSVGQVTEAGSIGVITVHREMSKAMERDGVKATVIKAGDHKGNGNPYEPLSDKARAEIQGQLDHMYGIFMGAVADNRGMSYPVADGKMGQGRTFIGTQAVEAGLADSVTTFDAVVSKRQGEIDASRKVPQYGANFQKGTPMKVALTEQQISAMAELGAHVAEGTAVVPTTPSPAPEAAAPSAETAPAPVQAKPAEAPELVAFLKTSLAEAQAANVDLTVQLRDAKASAEAMTTTHTALRSIAAASVDRLKIALGGTAGGADALSDTSLLAEHATLRAQFESKFKAGGVAAVSSTAQPDAKSEVADPVRQARLASTRFAK